MNIYDGKTIRLWDQFTIEDQGIFSWDLMERAAKRLTEKVLDLFTDIDLNFYIFVGPGNNGGDGLAMARMLRDQFRDVYVILLQNEGSPDYEQNMALIRSKSGIQITGLKEFEQKAPKKGIIIDCIFGSGLNRAPEDKYESAIRAINHSNLTTISIDLPSGMPTDTLPDWAVVQADHTLLIQTVKFSSLFPEGGKYYGKTHVVNINLSSKFEQKNPSDRVFVELAEARKLFKPRNKFSHKGTFGHAALACGSDGMMGAAILSVKGALKSGAGLVTAYIPGCGYEIMQISCPEAMCKSDVNDRHIKNISIDTKYRAVGIGSGLGVNPDTTDWLRKNMGLLKESRLVLDADALNAIAAHKIEIPQYAIITPHPGEFDRLFGSSSTGLERFKKQVEMATKYKIHIVLKGHFTTYVNPDGKAWFNSTGNPGMACGGSGDTLTGLLTGLLAQEYSIEDAVILGVFLHGLAGDLAADELSQYAMSASDIIQHLSCAWKEVVQK